jgi:LPXTG-motif cell wall-anchored protein
VEDVAEDGWVSVEVDNGMSIALDENAAAVLADIIAQTGSENITLDISLAPDTSKMEPEMAAKVAEAQAQGAIVFDFNFVDADTNEPLHFDTNNTGKVVVDIPVTPEQVATFGNTEKLVVVYIDNNGNIEYMDTWYDPATGKLTFATSHFSTYMVVEDDRPMDTATKPDGWYASLDQYDKMVEKDYEDKHQGVDVTVKSEATDDDNVQVTVTDQDGKVVDVYTIDAKTGTGTNQANQSVNLPKTGVTTKNPIAAVGSAIAATMAGLWLTIKAARRKKDEE